jgi:transposase
MSHDEHAAALKHEEIVALLVSHEQQAAEIGELKRQLEWFKRQVFGEKSERRPISPEARQLALGELEPASAEPATEITVAEHRRRLRAHSEPPDEEELRFDPSVPVEEEVASVGVEKG